MPHTTFTNTLTRGTPDPRLPPERRAAPASTRRPAPPQDPTPRTLEEGAPAARAPRCAGVEAPCGWAARAAACRARRAAPRRVLLALLSST